VSNVLLAVAAAAALYIILGPGLNWFRKFLQRMFRS
jgi:hypothetical protein